MNLRISKGLEVVQKIIFLNILLNKLKKVENFMKIKLLMIPMTFELSRKLYYF